MTMAPQMSTRTVAGWFGSNRQSAARVGIELGKLTWCGVPFCGGCPEIPHIRTRSGVASDLHRHLINLARCITEPTLFDRLLAAVDAKLFHPDELATAQRRCIEREQADDLFAPSRADDVDHDPNWAADYFVACWMGRGGAAGKNTEFSQSLSTRWTAGGGDSAVRYRSAVDSLIGWRESLKRWSFECIDCFDFLDRVKDLDGHGLYVDAPWPDNGCEYKHCFTDSQQARLAARLSAFQAVRVVVRFGDHPLVRHLYPEGRWRWLCGCTRNQRNNEVSEVLIVNGPSHSENASPVTAAE